MKRFFNILCGLLAALLVFQSTVMPVSALRIQITTHKSSGTEEDSTTQNYRKSVYDKVPLYLQTDYPDTMYGDGTIETSGCSIVSLAMVATYLTGHAYMPDELAYYFGGRAENNMARLEQGSETLQLPYEKTWYFYEALEALKQGKIIIALMEEQSPFTDSQHFVVLTGITDEGTIMVNDPFAPNYERWDLKEGFVRGFTEYEIMCGFSGAWIYDKDAMPEDPFIFEGDETTPNYHTPVSHQVPLYLQTDYPDTMYGSGTIETSGCSIVSLAMVATYLTGHTYMPDELADYFGGRAENNMARLEHGSEVLQLPYEKTWYFYDALDALKQGKIVIALMEEASPFTDSQHFVVLTGITKSGKILVNDPFGPNYDRWDLEDGFVNGFTEHEIMSGFSGAWIYDKNDMPAEPFIYKEEKPSREDTRYRDIELTAEERHLLARVIWVEARGESAEGQQAIAEIVFNRMLSEDFPETLNEVIYGEGQFRSVPYLEDAEPYQAQYDAIEDALYGPNILPENVFYFATTPTNNNIWGTIGGHIFCYASGT